MAGEQCEGMDLMGASCQTFGFMTGQLLCDPFKCSFDMSDCGATTAIDAGVGMGDGRGHTACGNGIIDKANGEQCEGANLMGASCMSLGFEGGTLLCSPMVCQFDTGKCLTGTD